MTGIGTLRTGRRRKMLGDNRMGNRPLRLVLMSDDLLNSAEAARRLGVCKATIRQLARTGKVPAQRLGNQLRFEPNDLKKALRDEKSSSSARNSA